MEKETAVTKRPKKAKFFSVFFQYLVQSKILSNIGKRNIKTPRLG